MGIFANRTALVTGGTRGLGRAIAMRLLKDGAKVAVSFRADEAAAERFVGEAAVFGGCVAVKADVSKAEDVRTLFESVKSALGAPDILVNNAGVVKDGFLMLMREEDWDGVVDVSLKGGYHCCKAACRGMVAAKYGRIINIVSPSAITGRAGQTNYSAAKGGLISFTKSLARELAPFNITVNAVSPGVVDTEMTSALPEKVRRELLDIIPLRRYGAPGEVAEAVRFLVSDEAAYITGQVLSVDGGITI